MGAGRRGAVLVAVAAIWVGVYVTAAWPRLAGPLPVVVLLGYGALPVPLPAGQGWRLFTTWLVHVDALHLVGNLGAWGAAGLPWPGPRGRRLAHLLTAFVCCGLGASLTVLLYYGRQPTISAGPSGALLGLVVVPLVQRGQAPRSRAVWLVTSAALIIGGVVTGGDSAAHLGGALTGIALGLLWRASEARVSSAAA